jgi:carbonic anhydrase
MKILLFHYLKRNVLEESSIKISGFLAIALMLSILAAIAAEAVERNSITSEQALQKLTEGNARFISGNVTHPSQSKERLQELVSGQHPFAVVVGCSDSRIPPEIIFDQGLGDIFVVRTAGKVLDNAVLGSIEYAVGHLGVPLVVVLGHDNCGAVKAAIEGGTVPGHLDSLVKFIQPAVDEAKKNGNDRELMNNSIDNNIDNVVDELNSSLPILSEKVEMGELRIAGARYQLDTGAVKFFE